MQRAWRRQGLDHGRWCCSWPPGRSAPAALTWKAVIVGHLIVVLAGWTLAKEQGLKRVTKERNAEVRSGRRSSSSSASAVERTEGRVREPSR